MDATARTARRAARRRLLPGAGRPVRHDAAGRPGRRRGQGRGARTATTPAPGCRPTRDGVSTYYLGINRNKRSIALDLRDDADLDAGPRARPPRRRPDRELPARRPGQVRPRLRRRCAPPTRASSTPRSAGSAPASGAALPGYDLMVQAMSGLMSLTGDPDGPPYRAGISVFDVMAGNARGDRHPGRAATPRRDRAGPARRGQPAVLGAVRAGQPQLGVVVAGGRGARSGWATRTRASSRTSRCPTADARPDRRPRPTTGSSASSARCSASPRWPTTRGSAATATARPTGTSCGRCWSSGWRTRTARRVVRPADRRRACRAGRSTRSTTGSPSAEQFGARARGRRSGEGDAGAADRPGTRSRSPRRRPATRCRRRSWTSTAPSSGPGSAGRPS